jgi:hypothetical protein
MCLKIDFNLSSRLLKTPFLVDPGKGKSCDGQVAGKARLGKGTTSEVTENPVPVGVVEAHDFGGH